MSTRTIRVLWVVCLGCACAFAARGAEPDAKTNAVRSFGGQVEGVKGPLAGVKVTVTFSESTEQPLHAANRDDGAVLAREVATTDADGKYRTEVPADLQNNPLLRVSLAFAHPEYLRRKIDSVPVADFSGRAIETGELYWAHRQEVQQAIRQTRLRQGKPLAGRVLTADGKPAAGAKVVTATKYQAYSWKFSSPDDYAVSDFAVTDNEGRFTTVTDTLSSLSVELPGHAPLLIGDLNAYPGVKEAEREFLMPPGFAARGRVLDAAGQPIGGAVVSATLATKWDEFDMPMHLTRAVAADRLGNFELPPLPAGRYRFAVHTRVADLEKIAEFNANHDVPTEALSDVILPVARALGGDGAVNVELRAVETATITFQVEFPDGLPQPDKLPILVPVSGNMNGEPWSGISARVAGTGEARMIVPRGVEDVVIHTPPARFRRNADADEQIGRAIHLGTVHEDLAGPLVNIPRLAVLKVKLKLPPGFYAPKTNTFVYINTSYVREGYEQNRPTPQPLGLFAATQSGDNDYRASALPNEEFVLKVTKRVDKVDTIVHEERLTLQPGEERLREIAIENKP